MNKDQLFPLIFGLVLGILLMFFWNLGSNISNQNLRLRQLEQIANENSQRIEQTLNFLNATFTAENQIMDTEEDIPMITE